MGKPNGKVSRRERERVNRRMFDLPVPTARVTSTPIVATTAPAKPVSAPSREQSKFVVSGTVDELNVPRGCGFFTTEDGRVVFVSMKTVKRDTDRGAFRKGARIEATVFEHENGRGLRAAAIHSVGK